MKVLVTGSNGFIGSYILDALNSINGIDATGLGGYSQLDLCDEAQTISYLDSLMPDVIVNTAAISVMAKCEEDPSYAKRLNTDVPARLASWCKTNSARLIQLSTDTVFYGAEKIFHKEDDTPCPPNVYGRTKADAEAAIIAACDNYAIVRVVLVYGVPRQGQHGNIVKMVMDKLSAGESVNMVNDQWRTPTYVGDVVDAVVHLVSDKRSGIWHICGAECMSIYDIALTVAKSKGLDTSLVQPMTTGVQNCGFVRPVYGLLDITKAKSELGFKPLALTDALKLM